MRRAFACLALLLAIIVSPSYVDAQLIRSSCCDSHQRFNPGCTDCVGMGGASGVGDSAGGVDGVGDDFSQIPTVDPSVGADLFSINSGLEGSQTALTPNSIGDLRAGSFSLFTVQGIMVDNPLVGGDRRFKVTENFNPNPTNRVFFNYNHYHNSVTGLDGTEGNLDRYTFGLEKMIGDISSIEVRIPFSNGLAPTQVFGQRRMGYQFGNVTLISKTILTQTNNSIVSGGVALTLPTAQNATVALAPTEVLTFVNDAYHLQPYIGFSATSDMFFMQAYGAVDFVLNGDVVRRQVSMQSEKYHDQNLLSLDAIGGVWLSRNNNGFVTASAGVVELHYITTVNDTDTAFEDGGGGALLLNQFNRMDILNLTTGIHLYLGESTRFTIGAGVPLRTVGPEKLFDAEIVAQFNRYF